VEKTELRPLGAGELLDRAVTLYVRRFGLIVAVIAAVVAPLMIIEAIVSPNSAGVWDDLAKLMSASGNSRATQQALAQMNAHSTGGGVVALIAVLGILARLMMFSAVVAVVAAAYAGARTTFGDAYRIAGRRWGAQLLVALAYLGIAMVAFIPLMIVYIGTVFVVALLAIGGARALAIGVGILGGIVVLGLFASVGAWLYMAYQLSAVAVVTEGANPPAAIGAGLRRAFGNPTRWRTLAAGLTVIAVSFGGTLPILAIAAAASATLHQPALYFAILGAGSVLLEGLVAAFVVVYAVDVRVRREGLDLFADAQPVPR
jgi:hypothetical protein